MKNKWRVLSGVLCAAFLCTACSGEETGKVQIGKYEEQKYQPKLDALRPSAYGSISNLKLEPGTYISVIGKDDKSEFWKSVEEGAKQAAADINKMMGYKGEDKVKVVYSGPAKGEDVEEQVNILDEELSRNPSALAISIIDADACEVQFDLAADDGIPIVMYDSGSLYQSAVSMIGTNNKEAGKTVGSKLGDAIGESGKVVLFMPDSKSTSSIQREEGIREVFQVGYENVEIIDSYHSDELQERIKKLTEGAMGTEDGNADSADTVEPQDTESNDTSGNDGEEADAADNAEGNGESKEDSEVVSEIQQMTELDMIKYILEANPDLAGCVAGNERMTKLVIQAAGELGLEELKIVGFDGGKKQLQALENGKIEGLLIQNPFGMGYATVVAAARAILDEGNEASVDCGYIWVTQENLKEESIQEMLY